METPEVKHFDCVIEFFSLEIADQMIDAALAAGHPFHSLRWRFSLTQRRMIRRWLRSLFDNLTLRRDAEFGGGRGTGMFAGVPYFEDREIAEGAVVLEVIQTTRIVSIARGLLLDRPLS